jgi:formylglycine-generating enzyme required for sulfatase activity
MSTAADGAAAAGGLLNWSGSSARHSPFTTALLNNIAAPGLDVKDMFYKVGRDVVAATGGKQRPEISISMYEQYALAPAAGAGAAAAALPGGSQPGAAALPDATSNVSAAVATPAASSSSLPVEPKPVHTVPIPPVAGTKEPAAHAPSPEPAKPTAGQQTAAVAPPVKPAVPEADPCGGPITVSFASRCAAPLTAAQERGLKPKDTFRECEKCPEMVMVPSGTFTMGGAADEEGVTFKEVPQHRVVLRQALAAGRFSVTFDEWEACVADGGCNGYRPDDKGWGRGLRPVINVSWDDARNYVAWLSRKTGKAYRLLSEAEREYVTRAGTTTPFWWGSSVSTQQANYNGRYPYGYGPRGEFRQRTLPVDSFGPNPWGLHQVHGNVFEWTEDCAHGDYKGAPSDGSAWTTGRCDKRIVRGGSWYDGASDLRAASRNDSSSNDRSNEVGFRVARALLAPVGPE